MTYEELLEKKAEADKRKLLHFIAVTQGNLNAVRNRGRGHREVLHILHSLQRATQCTDTKRNPHAQMSEIFDNLTVAVNTIRREWGSDFVDGGAK